MTTTTERTAGGEKIWTPEEQRRFSEDYQRRHLAGEALKTAKASRLKVDPALRDNPAVVGLLAKADPHSERVRAIPVKLRQIIEKRQTDTRAVDQDRHLTPQGKREKAARITQKAASDIAALGDEFESSKAAIESALAAARVKEEGGTQAQILAEMRTSRISQKVQAQLSAAGSDHAKVTHRLQRLVDATPDAELSTLQSEILFQTDGGSFGGDFARAFVNRAIAPRYEASLPPVEAAALQIERDAASGLSRVATSLNLAAAPSGSPILALPDWEAGQAHGIGGVKVTTSGGE